MQINETVKTAYGMVKGVADNHQTLTWKGIPYASPPVGELRWKAPKNPEPWEGVKETREFNDIPFQYSQKNKASIGSEDCLYLNIWRPDNGEKKLPVYFWIHGGGNNAQLPMLSEILGAAVSAQSNMVFVSMNYRLGEFGWFSHPALRSGKPGAEYDDSGNYGTLDIIKALEWVKENIRSFGGDPDNVFVAGESAGAFNTLTLLVSPAAKGLFHKAMAQSGRQNTYTLAEGDAEGNEYLIRLLINDRTAADRKAAKRHIKRMPHKQIANYLRSKPFEDFYACRPDRSPFMAGFEDGAVIASGGFDTLDNRTYPNKVPIIIGMNKEESKFKLLTLNEFRDDEKMYRTIAQIGSDLKKANGCDDLLRRLRANGDQPDVYGYQFCWGAEQPDGKSVIPPPYGLKIGAAHALDIPFFFDLNTSLFVGSKGDVVFTEKNLPGRKALSGAMIGYIKNFAHIGNPNTPGSGLPEWKPWSNEPGKPKCIRFDADYDHYKIDMILEELTWETVLADLNNLEEPFRSRVNESLIRLKLL